MSLVTKLDFLAWMLSSNLIDLFPADLRAELQREFVKRRKSNRSYSLPAYAKYLDVDQCLLSKLMNGQRTISTTIAEKITPKLKIKPSEAAGFFYPFNTSESIQYQYLFESND